ncbi:MAG: DUF3015 family protein [Nitrospirae bacterium]|nr:DUF3015 family protein [Candidatus Manganitrophaceae bacterium]
MKKLMLAIVGILMFSPTVFAAGYGEAGCGLGSLIFGSTPGFVQIFAATTNASTYSQGFGITSGTSNCDAKGFDVSQVEQEKFVAHNFSGLAKEMATGEGEQLATLAGMLGCPSVKQTQFNATAQRNYGAIYASDTTSPTEMLTAVKAVVARDQELSTACSSH